MGPEPSDGASGLPAPYRNPWRNLADDLRAVRADLGLRIWQAWRRNREGSLWRPSWWPRELAPLFWPLLAGVLPALLLVLLLSLLPLGLGRPAPPEPALIEADAAVSGPVAIARDAVAPEAAQSGGEAAAAADHAPDDPVAPTDTAAAITPLTAPEAAVASPAQDPLALLLASEQLAGLVVSAEPQADGLGLRLQVAPSFQRLAAPERQRRAELWLAQVQALGYDHLELRDGRGRLQGRDALVGGGMIVFSSDPFA